MRHRSGFLFVGFCLAAVGTGLFGDDVLDDAVKKERKLIEGTWQVLTVEINGNKLMESDARKFTAVNGEGLRSPVVFSMRETGANDIETDDKDTGGPKPPSAAPGTRAMWLSRQSCHLAPRDEPDRSAWERSRREAIAALL
jgi:hypothetical protein